MSTRTEPTPPRRPRACIELGVCQSRPDCGACTQRQAMRTGDREAFFFAPGALEKAPPRRRADRFERGARIMLIGVVVAAVGSVIGALGGWLHLGAPLP